MADREFTLLALHFHSHGDISISPGIETGGGESAFGELLGTEARSSGDRTDEESSDGGRRLPIVALAIVVAAAAAAALRRRRSAREPTEDKRRIPPT